MPVISISRFKGAAPAVSPRLLGEQGADDYWLSWGVVADVVLAQDGDAQTERVINSIAKTLSDLQVSTAPQQISIDAKMQPPEPATWVIEIYSQDGKTVERTARISREVKKNGN